MPKSLCARLLLTLTAPVIAGLASGPAGAEDQVETQETQPAENGGQEIISKVKVP